MYWKYFYDSLCLVIPFIHTASGTREWMRDRERHSSKLFPPLWAFRWVNFYHFLWSFIIHIFCVILMMGTSLVCWHFVGIFRLGLCFLHENQLFFIVTQWLRHSKMRPKPIFIENFLTYSPSTSQNNMTIFSQTQHTVLCLFRIIPFLCLSLSLVFLVRMEKVYNFTN